jgi:signal transduction histidine kinase
MREPLTGGDGSRHSGNASEAERIEALEKLRSYETLASISRAVSTLSHALGTPLNVIAGRAAMIGFGDLPMEEAVNNARIIERQVRQITELVQNVLDFVRQNVQAPERVHPEAIVAEVIELYAPLARERGVRLASGELESGEALMHRQRLLGVLTTFISFGLHHSESGQSITLTFKREQAEPPLSERGRVRPGVYLRFTVSYSNVQFPASMLAHVYEPWFNQSTDDRVLAAQLAICFGMAREHRGWVEINQPVERGAVVSINWPTESR